MDASPGRSSIGPDVGVIWQITIGSELDPGFSKLGTRLHCRSADLHLTWFNFVRVASRSAGLYAE